MKIGSRDVARKAARMVVKHVCMSRPVKGKKGRALLVGFIQLSVQCRAVG